MLARLGAGFDIVSGGELQRVMAAAPRTAAKVVFSGVGKLADEIDQALRAAQSATERVMRQSGYPKE